MTEGQRPKLRSWGVHALHYWRRSLRLGSWWWNPAADTQTVPSIQPPLSLPTTGNLVYSAEVVMVNDRGMKKGQKGGGGGVFILPPPPQSEHHLQKVFNPPAGCLQLPLDKAGEQPINASLHCARTLKQQSIHLSADDAWAFCDTAISDLIDILVHPEHRKSFLDMELLSIDRFSDFAVYHFSFECCIAMIACQWHFFFLQQNVVIWV